MLNVNTTAIVKGNKVAMLHLAKRGGGVIVNTASVAGVSDIDCLYYVADIFVCSSLADRTYSIQTRIHSHIANIHDAEP